MINQSPTIEILEGFENDSLKPLSLKSKEKSSGPKIYNSTTLHQHPSFKESNYEDEEDEDGDLSNYYGSSTTPSRPKPKKREFSPENLENTNKKRLTADNLSYSPTTTKPYGGNSILIQSFSIRNFQNITPDCNILLKICKWFQIAISQIRLHSHKVRSTRQEPTQERS